MSDERQEFDNLRQFLKHIGLTPAHITIYIKKLEKGGYTTAESLRWVTKLELRDLGFRDGTREHLHAGITHYFQGSSLFHTVDDFEEKRYYATGSTMIDELFIDGEHIGLPSGNILELWGEAGTGKSQLCLTVLLKALSQGSGPVVYIDTENSLSLPRINQLTQYWKVEEQMERFRWSSIRNLDELDLVLDEIGDLVPDVVVIDNIYTPMVKCYPVSGEYLNNYEPRDEHISVVFAKLRQLADQGTLVIYTNQVQENIRTFYGPLIIPRGSESFRHLPDITIHLKKAPKADSPWFDNKNHPQLGLVSICAEITKAKHYKKDKGYALISPFGISDPRMIKQIAKMAYDVGRGMWFDFLGHQYHNDRLSSLVDEQLRDEYGLIDY